MNKLSATIIFCFSAMFLKAQQVYNKNDKIERVLQYENKIWRTVKFASLDGKNNLLVQSDEFIILPINSNQTLSIADFEAMRQPKTYHKSDTSFCEIAYKPSREAEKNPASPQHLTIIFLR